MARGRASRTAAFYSMSKDSIARYWITAFAFFMKMINVLYCTRQVDTDLRFAVCGTTYFISRVVWLTLYWHFTFYCYARKRRTRIRSDPCRCLALSYLLLWHRVMVAERERCVSLKAPGARRVRQCLGGAPKPAAALVCIDSCIPCTQDVQIVQR